MPQDQLLFFDLDDTLVDHCGAEEAAQRETYASRARVFGGVAFENWFASYRRWNLALWNAFGNNEISRHELLHRRFAEPLFELGLDPKEAPRLWEIYRASYESHWRLNEGAEEILADASQLGIVGILSNGLVEAQRAKVKRFGLERWVGHVILSEEVGVMKPNRGIFDAAWQAGAGGRPVRKLYIGDSVPHDVVGAKRAGWLPVLFSPNGHACDFPVLYVRRLVDLKPLLE